MFQKHPLLTAGALFLAALAGSLGAYAPLWYSQAAAGGANLGTPSLYQALVCPGGAGLVLSTLAAFWTGQTVFRLVTEKGRGAESRQWLIVAFAASLFASAAGSLVIGVFYLALVS